MLNLQLRDVFGLSRDLTSHHELSREMQADVTGFMKDGKLSWPQAFTDDYIASGITRLLQLAWQIVKPGTK